MGSDPPTTSARLERLFAEQAVLTPEKPAIFFHGQVVSYNELNTSVDELARDLARHGVGPGVIVAISLQRTPAMITAIIATLKAGGAYLPLDARYPEARAKFVLSDSGASVLLVDRASPPVAGFCGEVLELIGGPALLSVKPSSRSCSVTSELPADLAYVIYTSGSTGAPKGVMLGHGATHLVAWARGAYSDVERSRVAATTSLCFDPSIFEIFVPLCTGGAIILKENALEPFAADERPTMLDSVPSVLAELIRADAIPESVQVLNVGGEPLGAELARDVYQRRPHLILFNHYGPTEATTCATVAQVARDAADAPSIGRPVRGAEVVLLDQTGRPVSDGEIGEIHIGGPALALGYLNRPELTAERFIAGATGRLYRTGDLACRRGGELHFRGRTDQQVKVRGFRIELGEVEAALLKVPHVEQALALVRETSGRAELLAYVQSHHPLTPAGVREALTAWLPAYMLPGQVVVLKAFPRLVSGKLDRSALPSPAEDAAGTTVEPSRMEWPIIEVFQEVLGRRGLSPEASFFELGGDSLSSVRAALRLSEVLGYELPAALIHQAPTPRALAASLDHARLRADGHIGLLQPGGPGAPLFCVADLFGQAFNYLSLARRLAADRPVYGVVPGPLQDAFARNGDLPRLTESFVAEVRRIRPHGPYLIAGYSSGGLLAQDIACLLERQGEEVSLILLDAYLYSRRPSAKAFGRWSVRRGRSLLSGRRYLAAQASSKGLLGKLMRRVASGAAPEWIPRPQIAFASRMVRSGLTFRPGTFRGSTLILKATDREPVDELFDTDGLLGWSGALNGDVVQETVEGSHSTFMREPAVDATSAAVRRFLLAHG